MLVRFAWPPMRWRIVLACNLLAIVTWGVGTHSHGVFVAFLTETRGWAVSELAAASFGFHLVAGVAGACVGRIVDRRGPGAAFLAGATGLSLGALAFGFASQTWHLYVAFLAMGVGFASMHLVTIGKIVALWFRAGRARAMTLVTFGASVGGALIVPATASTIERHGQEAAGLLLFAIALIGVALVAPILTRRPRDQSGQDGQGAGPTRCRAAQDRADEREWTLRAAVRTRAFWALAIAFPLAMAAQSSMLLFQFLYVSRALDAGSAAMAVSLAMAAGVAGRVCFAIGGDRWSGRATATAAISLQACSFVVFGLSDGVAGLFLGSAVFGFTTGLVIVCQPLVAAECFGQRSFGRVFGLIYFCIRLGSALGPLGAGLAFEAAGSFSAVWLSAAIVLAVAAAAAAAATPPPPIIRELSRESVT